MSASKEFCFGCKLSSEEPAYVWDPENNFLESSNDETGSTVKGFVYSLILKHVVLDADAKVGEVNVVELETNNFYSEVIKQPMVHLVNGRTEQCPVDILLTEPYAKLSLIKGSGPVYIWGQLILELDKGDDDFVPESHYEYDSKMNVMSTEDDEDDKEMEGEEVDKYEIEDIVKDEAKIKNELMANKTKKVETVAKIKKEAPTKKRKTSESKVLLKKPKLSVSDDSDDDEEEDEGDDEEEDEEEEKKGKENLKTSKPKSIPVSSKKSIKKKQPQKHKGC